MFVNREEAGLRLALKLSKEKVPRNSILISIPRGGVVVGKTVSEVLGFPLRALLVKKIAVPQNPELAIGATGRNGVVFWDEKLIEYIGLSRKEREKALAATTRTIRNLERTLGVQPLKRSDLEGKTSIVVDDGVATGATAIASSMILRKLGSQRVILGTPVVSKRTRRELKRYFDLIVSVETPHEFQAVGQFYREFPQVRDEEVKELLKVANNTQSTGGDRR